MLPIQRLQQLHLQIPNNTQDAPQKYPIGDGVLNQLHLAPRGTGYTTPTATIDDTGNEQNITGVSFTENPYANTLLTANKEYVKDEVIAWINNSNNSRWNII